MYRILTDNSKDSLRETGLTDISEAEPGLADSSKSGSLVETVETESAFMVSESMTNRVKSSTAGPWAVTRLLEPGESSGKVSGGCDWTSGAKNRFID